MAKLTRAVGALALVAAVLCVLALPAAASSTFSVLLPRYTSECFYETLAGGDRLDVNFEVMSSTGGDLDLDYSISNPDGSTLHSIARERQAQFGFNAVKPGTYRMCFSNQRSSSEKVLSFSIAGPDEHKLIQKKAAKDDSKKLDENQAELFSSLQLLADNVRFMRDEQGYLIRRLQRHRQTADSTNGRVFWWSLFQAVLLIGACAFQVFYLRRFFETRRVV
ncbi:p24 complex component [Polyrhizophydium stewartii]|uniref:P24 complex component n=1 Tax=Polyrhizophydium stewartii TaxID=2732419 RepID=A0ABR4NIG4_9FUNG